MGIKKSELYFCLWQSCDELRSGMDASQPHDRGLIVLLMKYVSDNATALARMNMFLHSCPTAEIWFLGRIRQLAERYRLPQLTNEMAVLERMGFKP